MVSIDIAYEGALRTRMTHGPSGSVILTDAPTDNHGKGELFSPTDLLAASLASCMLTTIAIVAQRDETDLAGMRCRVDKHMVSEPVRRVGKLVVSFEMPAGLTPEQRKKYERVALKCPVHHSLSPETEILTSFVYPDVCAPA